ncbi:tRNA pseudouridine(38-40) synthase TruA [Siculibacillus lacustris]|uniref:tRNA pseudouridine synthase A n=1 Tax=Siculibacillus lacustris TaxID=1549641 RepID=A0A4Q9VTH9_9HYPH|nr:tRNA pseudouridine(38-40) synthase TruA [Siculibacillus lacustris]TBW39250.1 tRNA pseudouridine(38-40) synthase TruA [Siculibacillus lacustris]
MPRYRLLVEYDGTPYCGWQRQANGPSVQGTIETAFLRLEGGPVTLKGAGRTDTGVHATGQVAHVDFPRDWSADKLRDALNAHLKPHPVAILEVAIVGEDFDARFSAKARHYLYRIVDRRAPLALEQNRAWHVRTRLDEVAMQAAAQVLIGHHDFTTFRSTHCQSKSPMKTLDRLDVTRIGDTVEIRASARSFLHNQVRSMVGTVKLVGEGKWDVARVVAALDARTREACGAVAPAAGLILTRVDY